MTDIKMTANETVALAKHFIGGNSEYHGFYVRTEAGSIASLLSKITGKPWVVKEEPSALGKQFYVVRR